MIGTETGMVDSRDRVTGRIGFTVNQEPAGTVHVAIVRSTVAHGRLVSVDTAAAASLPGVVAVLTGADLLAGNTRACFGPVFRDQPVLAIDKVRYAGEPIAAVAAVDARTAQRAATLVDADFEELAAVFTPLEALADDAPILHEGSGDEAAGYPDIVLGGRGGNVCNAFRLRKGEAAAGLRHADRVFDHQFATPAVQHVSMEPHAAVAVFEADRLTVTTCTQTPYAVRDSLAHLFGLPASHVRVVTPPMGGAFGGKCYAKIEPLAAIVAQRTDRPAKLVVPREDEFVTNSKHQSFIRLRTGVHRDGTIVARQVDALFNAGAYSDISPRLIKNGGYGAVGPYRIPHVQVDSRAVFTNLPSAGAFRGYGVAQGAWAYETQLDIIAAELGIDPVELRRRNLLGEGDTFATGEELHDVRFREVLDDAVSLFDRRGADEPVPSWIRRGRGCAVIIKSTITPSTSNAGVKLNADGSAQVLTSTAEMGQGAHTALAQIAAGELGVDVLDVHIVGPDTDTTPYDHTTSSSRSTAAMGAAVKEATGDVKRRLLELAADQLEVEPGDLRFADGVVGVVGDPSTNRSIAEVIAASRLGTVTGDGSYVTEGGLDPETGQGVASEHWHQGAVAVEVDVDVRTGKVYVRRMRASVYAGTVVNPVNARMQVDGSLSFGISQALYEQVVHDTGHVVNANLSEYAIAGGPDLPEVMEVSLLEDPASDVVHGLGETALPPVSPAIGNAVADATGIRLLELPMTAERVLDEYGAPDG